MKRTTEENQGTVLEQRLDDAIKKKDATALCDELCRRSGLPGPRANTDLVWAFGELCGLRGAKSDPLIRSLMMLEADEAPGGSPLEILPMCGVAAATQRAAHDAKARSWALPLLHDACEDLRYRVRETVADGLGKLGARMGDVLVHQTAAWTDGYFHAATVVQALGVREWQAAITDDDEAVLRVHEAFDLLKTAQRAAARYPGHKALVEALVRTVPQLVLRFGPGILRELELRAASKDPDIRAIVEKVIAGTHIRSRFPEDHAAISKVLGNMAPKARDPGKELRPTRKRGRR